MNIQREFNSAIDELVEFYRKKQIDIRTPVTLKEESIDGIMIIETTTQEKGITPQEIINISFGYELIINYLGIKVPKEEIINNIIKNKKIIKGQRTIKKAEITYDEKLIKLLNKVKDPQKHFKIILSHELWHLIEHENNIYDILINEGTATYAMAVYGKYSKNLDKYLSLEFSNFKNMRYEYCAALVKKNLNSSKDIKQMLDSEIRKKITLEYKKELQTHAHKIFYNEMQREPWTFKEYLNKLFNIKSDQEYVSELRKSELYNTLKSEDKEKILRIYEITHKIIDKKK
ncbi:MAG: hypothetical protein KatS3mg002_0113 [Candidatus Woesearchaeota archaeon]|nr:MAG: hypothetical protein KatS3mg002_0113 [Candidatus Woesearchaeota archaeon]